MSAFARTPETPARFDWHEVTKVAHYYLSVDAMIQPKQARGNDDE